MRRLSFTVGLAALFTLVLAACNVNAGSGSATISLGPSSFTGTTNVTIKAGQAVHFVDPASGGTHVLCVGRDLMCIPQSGAPAALNTLQGLIFNTGDVRDIVFPNAGTYNVVCTIHPNMEVNVVVQP